MSTTFAALLCVCGIAVGQLLFKCTANSQALSGSYLHPRTLLWLLSALMLYGITTFGWIWTLQQGPLSRLYPWMALAFVLVSVTIVDAKPRAKGRSTRKPSGGDIGASFWAVLKITYLAVFLPLLLWFVFNIVRDPMSGKIAKEIWRRCKKRCISFLGRSRSASARKRRTMRV